MDVIKELKSIQDNLNNLWAALDQIISYQNSSPKSAVEIRTPLDKLGLSSRVKNALYRGGIEYVEQLLNISERDFLCIRGMGSKSIVEIMEKIKTSKYDFSNFSSSLLFLS